jgi:UDP-N-acetylmuramoylalanine--D-glutamate ligase
MKVAILGYDTEGKSSYEYFAARGHELTILDQNSELQAPDGAKTVLGESYLDDLDQYDLLVRTAGLPPARILDKNPGVADKITTQINEFMRVCPTRNIIGITGTKGKGTTSTMISLMLKAAGYQVFLGGNIGVAPLTFINDVSQDSWVVLELSSFQLIDLRLSPPIAVCLMMVPEHLNWHMSIDEYILSKQRLFAHQSPEDTAIYFSRNDTSRQIAEVGKGRKLPYFDEPGAVIKDGAIVIDGTVICRTDELMLIGEHNWQNVCAAVTAVWQVSQDVKALRSVLTSFSGLPHRIEFVRELDGVRYYNDSFASGLAATIAAIESIKGKKVVILGGFDRGLDISPFIEFCQANQSEFRSLLLIGQSADRLADQLREAGFTNYVLAADLKSMPEVVERARSLAQSGDSVILSPGFASFDMFKNFEDRGVKFKQAVDEL